MDLIGKVYLPSSKQYTFIIVATDYFTKWVEARSMKTINQTDVIKFIIKDIIHRFGIPKTITINRGTISTSEAMEIFVKEYGIKHTLSTPYFAQANGQAKATNEVLKGNLEKMVYDNSRDWHNLLSKTLWAYRTSKRSGTGTTPFALTYGYEVVLPMEYAHKKGVQHWCNEKGDIICEICHQPYQPGYTAPPPRPHREETSIDIGGGWTISATPVELDPRLMAMAEAERHFLEAEYDDYAASNASGAAFCSAAALILFYHLMALLLLRHAWNVSDDDADDDISAFFSERRILFLLWPAGFLLPCYIMAWAISILQRHRQRQEAAALAATQVAFVLQSGQRRGLQFAIASGPSGPSVTLHQEAF
ncbi:uncharacterized protein LOC107428981 [Ziziphus jujuba]|uniref:Uncharacterized protein LOC107428981 n=1 Tax=Ziziphus jujuba TaxID=326968 RepID=A0ABM3ZXC0_ZIZJJ|nr:uncharacterized protein LOC107428981 [Ziziphus jujuba]